MIVGKIQARKFPEVFYGGCIVGAGRILGPIEKAKMNLLLIGNDFGKPPLASLLKADAFISARVVAQLSLIAMILAMGGGTEVVYTIIAVIHVLVVNQILGHLPMDEEPGETTSEIPIAFEYDYPVTVRDNTSGLRTDRDPRLWRFYPRKYASCRIVRKVIFDQVQAHDLMVQHLVCRNNHARGVV